MRLRGTPRIDGVLGFLGATSNLDNGGGGLVFSLIISCVGEFGEKSVRRRCMSKQAIKPFVDKSAELICLSTVQWIDGIS